jgi:hypothetical protein
MSNCNVNEKEAIKIFKIVAEYKRSILVAISKRRKSNCSGFAMMQVQCRINCTYIFAIPLQFDLRVLLIATSILTSFVLCYNFNYFFFICITI